MKYIKSINEYNSDLYVKIGNDEWSKLKNSRNAIKFTKDEIDIISNRIKKWSPLKYSSVEVRNHIINNATVRTLTRLECNMNLDIYKFDDEWFLVYVTYSYENSAELYKCDQFEGLIKLIHDR